MNCDHVMNTKTFTSLPFGFSQRYINKYYEGFSRNLFIAVNLKSNFSVPKSFLYAIFTAYFTNINRLYLH